jgi:membrane fusion protein, heavy metal efflux system
MFAVRFQFKEKDRSMKRIALGLSVVAALAVLGGITLALARHDLVPSWARFVRPTAEDTADSGLYCKEHGVPEKFCMLCHAKLKEKLLLCKEHGNIPEDICTLCRPEVQKKHQIEMCPKGHGLPKYFCVKCGNAPSASIDAPDDGWCSEHNMPEALCAECLQGGRGTKTETARVCRQPLPVVRLASPKLAKQIGLKTAGTERQEVTPLGAI